jgi:hypothetical protein
MRENARMTSGAPIKKITVKGASRGVRWGRDEPRGVYDNGGTDLTRGRQHGSNRGGRARCVGGRGGGRQEREPNHP